MVPYNKSQPFKVQNSVGFKVILAGLCPLPGITSVLCNEWLPHQLLLGPCRFIAHAPHGRQTKWIEITDQCPPRQENKTKQNKNQQLQNSFRKTLQLTRFTRPLPLQVSISLQRLLRDTLRQAELTRRGLDQLNYITRTLANLSGCLQAVQCPPGFQLL